MVATLPVAACLWSGKAVRLAPACGRDAQYRQDCSLRRRCVLCAPAPCRRTSGQSSAILLSSRPVLVVGAHPRCRKSESKCRENTPTVRPQLTMVASKECGSGSQMRASASGDSGDGSASSCPGSSRRPANDAAGREGVNDVKEDLRRQSRPRHPTKKLA